ncbi:hypothetical protein ASPACDRAFT_80412 [Aspergillus aculeatus ATCC 16872]|uniref:Uncharacterized protein n=1 Tax=Aspergillus aculeatus (strain ATCC 16872 / CBS 172.66 / WB 5094) TaxID=690307 RepID=A0A1L9WN32_ASPA1|nr:uncharacterized protein ASPACDRAFT_80412 [Aspergillus aculeatus ATCC 16872]OJJ97589.1 hypothetical protein ASPACDRAFT_80412 [Aspergillus aculeatus ATCC 16872]
MPKALEWVCDPVWAATIKQLQVIATVLWGCCTYLRAQLVQLPQGLTMLYRISHHAGLCRYRTFLALLANLIKQNYPTCSKVIPVISDP